MTYVGGRRANVLQSGCGATAPALRRATKPASGSHFGAGIFFGFETGHAPSVLLVINMSLLHSAALRSQGRCLFVNKSLLHSAVATVAMTSFF